jgi:copper homeostasis protein (lipoprotein)
MKTFKILVAGLSVSLLLGVIGCQSQSSNTATKEDQMAMTIGDQSRNALDWEGLYVGELPCADCPGIKTALYLGNDGKYELQTRYVDRGDEVFIERGTFEWNTEGSKVTLSEGENKSYLVGENQLFALDENQEMIQGDLKDHYRLVKTEVSLTDTYWKLIEIYGKETAGIKTMREPYLKLNSADLRAEATGGCNGLGGGYELKDNQWGLKFTQFMSTQMACENMEIEQQFNQVMQQTDSYVISNDTLQLIRARMAPLAKFKAIHVK